MQGTVTSKVIRASLKHDPNYEEGRGTRLFVTPAQEASNLTLAIRPYRAPSQNIPPHIEITLRNKAHR